MFEKSFEKRITISPFVTEISQDSNWYSHIEKWMKEDVFDPLGKWRNKRQTVESEEDKNDVRYQNRAEITLGCE